MKRADLCYADPGHYVVRERDGEVVDGAHQGGIKEADQAQGRARHLTKLTGDAHYVTAVLDIVDPSSGSPS